MSSHHTKQPSATPVMTQQGSHDPYAQNTNNNNGNGGEGRPQNNFIQHTSEKLVDKVEDQAAEKAVDYATDPDKVQQNFDDAKEKAQGLWAKYCSCFSSLA